MRIIPVLDLMNGVAVRGVGGRRYEYRPVVSRLTPSSDPIQVAEAFRSYLGLDELYLADLDAIAGHLPALPLFSQLNSAGFRLWVDAGVRSRAGAESLIESGINRVVAGLETLNAPETLATLCERWSDRVVFSLDLKTGRPLSASEAWPSDPLAIAELVIEMGVRRVLVLDLSHVGEGRGTGTEELCRSLTSRFPEVEVSAGGGVRGVEDLERLRDTGIAVALAASALHDGRIGRDDLKCFNDQARHS